MMNATHGPSGTLAGEAALAASHQPADSPAAIAWLLGCTVGAMLPDADHPSSNTAQVWGPLTSIPCRALGRMAGGHREGTHDVSRGAPILFAAVFGLGLLVPSLYHGDPSSRLALAARLTGMGVVALMAGLAIIALAQFIPGKWEGNGFANLTVSWAIAYAVSLHYPTGLPPVVVVAAAAGIALGVLIGISGDGCTVSGVPWRGRDVHLLPRGLRCHTGRRTEVVFFRAPILAGVVALAYILSRGQLLALLAQAQAMT